MSKPLDNDCVDMLVGYIRKLEADNARLKAEVERLTKAGDVICRMAGNNEVINRHWKAAKNGGAS